MNIGEIKMLCLSTLAPGSPFAWKHSSKICTAIQTPLSSTVVICFSRPNVCLIYRVGCFLSILYVFETLLLCSSSVCHHHKHCLMLQVLILNRDKKYWSNTRKNYKRRFPPTNTEQRWRERATLCASGVMAFTPASREPWIWVTPW